MTTITINEDIAIPKFNFENLAEFIKTINSYNLIEKETSLIEYIKTGEVENAEKVGPISINQFIQELKAW